MPERIYVDKNGEGYEDHHLDLLNNYREIIKSPTKIMVERGIPFLKKLTDEEFQHIAQEFPDDRLVKIEKPQREFEARKKGKPRRV